MNCYGKILTFIVVVAATIGTSYAQPSTEKKSELASMTFQFGVKKLINQEASEASKYFDKSIELTDSTHSPSLYYKAMTISNSNPELALYLINKSVDIWHDNTNYLNAKAQLEDKLRMYKEALATSLQLYKISPNNPNYTYFCAVFYNINGDLTKANQFATEYQTKFGFNEKMYDIKYYYFLRNNKVDSLEQYVMKTFDKQPNSATVLANYGQLMSSKKNDSLALDAYNKAIEINPTNPQFYMALIDFNMSRKQYEPLFVNVKDLFSLDGIRVDFKINMVNQLINYIDPKGIYKEDFIDITNLIVDKDPDNAQAMQFYLSLLTFVNQNDKAYAFLKQKHANGELKEDMVHTFLIYIYNSIDRDNTIEIANQFLNVYPKNIDINNFMLAMLSINKEYKKVTILADKMIEFAPNDSIKSIIYVTKASASEHISTVKKTIKDFEYAIKFDPNNAMAFNNYAYFLAQRSIDLDNALILANKAIEINPEEINYIDTKAWVYFKMGKFNEANAMIVNMLTLNDNVSDEILLHIGDILFAKGAVMMAKSKWNSVKNEAFKEAVKQRLSLKDNDVQGLLKIINKYE